MNGTITTGDYSTLVQSMAWWHQAKILEPMLKSSMTSCSVTGSELHIKYIRVTSHDLILSASQLLVQQHFMITTKKTRNLRSIIGSLCRDSTGDRRIPFKKSEHYGDVIMSAMASQITGVSIVHSTDGPGEDQRKHQSSTSLAFVRGTYRSPVNSRT